MVRLLGISRKPGSPFGRLPSLGASPRSLHPLRSHLGREGGHAGLDESLVVLQAVVKRGGDVVQPLQAN